MGCRVVRNGQLSLLRAVAVAAACWLFLPHVAKAQWVIFHGANGVVARNIPNEAYSTLTDLARQGAKLKSIAFTGRGWVILHDRNSYFARNIPDDAFNVLGNVAKQGAVLRCVAFTPTGGWAIIHGRNGFAARNIPDEAFKALGDLAKKGAALKSIAFTPDGGWVILHDRSGYVARNIPDKASSTLRDLAGQQVALNCVTFPSRRGWAILHGTSGYVARNIPDEPFKAVAELARAGAVLKCLSFGAGAPVLIALSQDDKKSRAQVLQRLHHHKVPGLSVAVVANHNVAWARGYGVARAGADGPVTPATRFQAASISKVVAALAALRLVQQGKLDLDGPLNEKLVSWKVAGNEFTRQRQATLRQLLSHAAGFPGDGYDGYEAGHRLPTLRQILKGQPPANSKAVRVERVPGSKYQYSGAGYTVLQQLIVDVTRTPFPKAMQNLVLDPVGMKHSTFQQPPPAGFEASAAAAHDKGSALPGNWRVYPELAAAGMWTTSSDLARLVVALQKARRGDRDAILSPALTDDALRRQIANQGLGIALQGQGRSLLFLHYGTNAGFECCMMGAAESGQGAVLMTNAIGGHALIEELLECIRTEYGW